MHIFLERETHKEQGQKRISLFAKFQNLLFQVQVVWFCVSKVFYLLSYALHLRFSKYFRGKRRKPSRRYCRLWYKIRSFLSKQGVFFQQIAGPSILWLKDFFNGGCITHVITRLLGSNEINYLIAAREVGMRRNVAPSFILQLSMALIS